MSQQKSPLSNSEAWNLVAAGYAETTMVMFGQFADAAIAAVNPKPGAHLLDVACGPGTLALRCARDAERVHGIDFSQAMLDCFAEQIEREGHTNIDIHCGDAQQLPYESDSFDAVFSLFGLMFFPDRVKGFTEIHRTLKPGGRVAVTSWAPVDMSPAMMTMFGAIKAMKPEIPEPQRAIDTLENPELFEEEMREAGFRNVEIRKLTGSFPVESIDGFWDSMVRGSAPIQMMKKNMSEEEWREKEQVALAFLEERLPNTPTELTSDAWLGTGVKS